MEPRMSFLAACLMGAALGVAVSSAAEPKPAAPAESQWADWGEPGFPFFSSILDVRKAGAGFPTNNLTPRGLVLNLGRDLWACFDTDLLRVAAIWRGEPGRPPVTPDALAPKSYHLSGGKTPGGQFPAPQPVGTVWLANGIYPGWHAGETFSPDDPREPAPSPHEVGRGPLPEAMGRFKAVRRVRDGVVLEYTVAGADVREWWTVSERGGQPVVERHIEAGNSSKPLLLALGVGGASSVS
jgi:hypothetical protein